MKIKRILCLCISAVILLSAVGCGSKGAESGNPEQSNKTLAENFGGREVVISGTTLLGGDENSTTYAEEMEFLKELEKKYNCTIKYDVPTDWASYHSSILTKALAGEKIGDVFCATGVDIFPKWALNDLVAPIDDCFDLSNPIWNADYLEDVLYNGQHYGVSNWRPAVGNVILFNKRLCASLGVSDKELYELQKNNGWTWDKFLSYAQKCTKLGADENSSTYGFAWDGHYSPTNFMYSNGDVPVKRNGNSYIYNLNSTSNIEAIQFSSDLVHKYKVVPSTSTSGGTTLWKKGKVAFFSTAFWAYESYVDVLKDDGIGILLNPIGPKANDYINVTDTPSYFFIQPCVEDKELVAQLLTELVKPHEWDTSDYTTDYDPALNYLDSLFDDESAETLRMIKGRTIVDAGGYSTEFRSEIYWGDYGITDGVDPRTWTESKAATGQYYLDSVWSQEFTVTQAAE